MNRATHYQTTNEYQINEYAKKCQINSSIKTELYLKYKVNRGLRDLQGNGVLTGLTEISEIKSKNFLDGQLRPCIGELFYRGYNVKELIAGLDASKCFGFEEISYLLLVGDLPKEEELTNFIEILSSYRLLSENFIRDIIFKAPSGSIMNSLSRCVLSLYAYDE